MGLRKLGEDTKVTKMKIVPTSEKQDAIRSVVSSAVDSPAVREGMVGRSAQWVSKSVQCSRSQTDTACISAQRRVLTVGPGRGNSSRGIAISIFSTLDRLFWRGALLWGTIIDRHCRRHEMAIEKQGCVIGVKWRYMRLCMSQWPTVTDLHVDGNKK